MFLTLSASGVSALAGFMPRSWADVIPASGVVIRASRGFSNPDFGSIRSEGHCSQWSFVLCLVFRVDVHDDTPMMDISINVVLYIC